MKISPLSAFSPNVNQPQKQQAGKNIGFAAVEELKSYPAEYTNLIEHIGKEKETVYPEIIKVPEDAKEGSQVKFLALTGRDATKYRNLVREGETYALEKVVAEAKNSGTYHALPSEKG